MNIALFHLIIEKAPLSIKDGKRSGVYNFIKDTARLYPNNLEILTDTLVTKILLDSNNKAFGVQIARGKSLYQASPKSSKSAQMPVLEEILVNREVIVSAGTFATPQLLQLSGLGDRARLNALGIPTKVHRE
jgi:choline dehydrogenase-like flavoprotein